MGVGGPTVGVGEIYKIISAIRLGVGISHHQCVFALITQDFAQQQDL